MCSHARAALVALHAAEELDQPWLFGVFRGNVGSISDDVSFFNIYCSLFPGKKYLNINLLRNRSI